MATPAANSVAVSFQAAADAHAAGDLVGAESGYRSLLRREPDHAAANHNLGVLAAQCGRTGAGVPHLRRAVAAAPAAVHYRETLAEALAEVGAHGELKQLLFTTAGGGMSPALRDLARRHGATANWRRELERASARTDHRRVIELARALVAVDANDGRAWYALGVALVATDGHDAALGALQRAADLAPADARVHHALGEVHRRTGRYDAALRHYRAALAVAPDFARAHLSTGHALASSGRPEAALEHYDAAGRLAPEDAELWFVRANAERRLQRIDAARASYERAIALAPHDVRNHTNMAVLLIEERRFRAAAAALRRARRCRPDSDAVARNLGSLLMRCGRARLAKRAFATARRCAEAAGGARGAPAENHHSAYLHAAAYADDHDPAAYLAQARAWTTVAGVTPTTMPARVPAAAREVRRLRVGYLTGALHEAHPLASFVEAIFGAYDPHRQEVFVYANLGKVDAFTTRQRRRVTGWRDIAPLSDAAACERIRADGLDVLVDLGGHLQRHRMGVVARRVAPAQAHYLGYFASTGVPAVDYWIADDVLIPPAHEAYFSETVWRLDRPWLAYDGDPTLPVAGAGDTARPVRLGTFNALVKVTPATVALWARVLHTLPAAELFLKTKELADHGNRTRLVRAFARHGIDSARLRLADRNNTPDRHAHMCAYHGLDVALDPVGGVSGATTTCDALWMGVPVVTLPGPHTGGRLSTALLHAVGHEEWVAEDEAAYVATVRALVRDGARSADARGALRAEMAGSHLCDARGLARALDDAYAAMAATGAPAAGDAR